MDKLQLKGRNLGQVFNSRSGRAHAVQLHFSETKQPNLKLKTRPKQLLGSLPLVIALHPPAYFRLRQRQMRDVFKPLPPGFVRRNFFVIVDGFYDDGGGAARRLRVL
jgi:hypothetical protein